MAALLPVDGGGDGDGDEAGIEGVCEDDDGDAHDGLAPHEGACGAWGM